MLKRLSDMGMTLSIAEVEVFTGAGNLGRPHLARALVERGVVGSVKEAFDRLLGNGKPAFVERFNLGAAEAIRLIHGAGGVATLAHPKANKIERGELQVLKELGLDGLEVFHADHGPSIQEKYLGLAAELDLVPTAGSDFHGEAVAPARRLGMVTMPEGNLERLESRRAK